MGKKFITDISKDEVKYVEDDLEKIIDLHECYGNWVGYVGRNSNDTKGVSQIAPYVGERNIDGNPPYIIFFTRPFTKIEFCIGENDRNQEEFREAVTALQKMGWRMIDMS